MKETIKYDFCEISIFNHYVVVVAKEGITLTPKHNKVLLKIKDTYFPNNTPFVYITHRINSYAVDPKIYFETSKIKNLIGFAVVSSNFQAKKNAQIEQRFFDKPFKVFSELEDAVAWAEEMVKLD